MSDIQGTIIMGPGRLSSHILDTRVTIITQAGLVLALAGALVIALRDPRNAGEIAETHKALLESLGVILIKGEVITVEDFETFKRGDPEWDVCEDESRGVTS